MTEKLSLLLALAAGLLSFLSPCVLPLIPSYLSILGAVGLDQRAAASKSLDGQAFGKQAAPASRRRLLRTAACFCAGFSAVFIILSILVSTTFSLMGGISAYISRAAGIVVIILGMNVIFDFLSFLNYEKRPFLRRFSPGRVGSAAAAFIAGAAFGAGWTPCIGPILTSILLMAGQSGKAGTAVFYLAAYSFGLAVPFLLAALFFDSFLKHSSRLRSRLPLIKIISGVLLVVMGVMIL
jgi:cytochrome c-type biogenesis protein